MFRYWLKTKSYLSVDFDDFRVTMKEWITENYSIEDGEKIDEEANFEEWILGSGYTP